MCFKKPQAAINLIYPPFAHFLMPYSSLPILTSFLRSYGYTVVQEDCNIEFMEYIFSKNGLSLMVFKLLNEKLKNKLDITTYLAFMKHVMDNGGQAKDALRDGVNFFNPERYVSSWVTMMHLLNTLSYVYSSSKFNYSEIMLDMRYSSESSLEIMQAIFDKGENPFISFFDRIVIPRLIESNPNLIGISITYRSQLIPGITLARLIKDSGLNVHITMGGAYISYISDYFSENLPFFKYVDSFITNEGEHSLLKLKRKIDTNDVFFDVPNIICISNGRIVKGPRYIENLDELGTPDYEGLPMHLYFSGHPVYIIETSRGCPYRCAFCATSHQFKVIGYRERSMHLVLQDLQKISKKNNQELIYVYFSDDTFRVERLRELSELLVKTKISNIRWICETRFEEGFTKELCRLIYQAGCRKLCFGLESANQRVLDAMNKGTKVDHIKQTLCNVIEAGIATNCQFFLGFPTETESEASETIDFLVKNKALVTSYGLGNFLLLKDSPIFKEPYKYGINLIKDPTKDLQVVFKYQVKEGINQEKAEELYKQSFDKLYGEWFDNVKWPLWGADPHTFLFLSKYGLNFISYLKDLCSERRFC